MQTIPSAQEFPPTNEPQRSNETLRSISGEMETAKEKLQLIRDVRAFCDEFDVKATAGMADEPKPLESPASVHRSGARAAAAVKLIRFNLPRRPRHVSLTRGCHDRIAAGVDGTRSLEIQKPRRYRLGSCVSVFPPRDGR